MLTVFAWEYASALEGGSLPDSIRVEGWAMLAAVLEDFARAGVHTVTLLNAETAERCASLGIPVEVHRTAFDELAARADFTLLIAPESDWVLSSYCRRVLAAGGRLLGPTPKAVDLTADKFVLAQHLAAHGVSTPPCFGLCSVRVSFPAVLKPRDGAGSQATFLVRTADEVPRCLAVAHAEGWDGEPVVQSFVPGQPASVAFLLGPRQRVALLPAEQHLSDEGRFLYRGGRLPLPQHLAARAVSLAERAVAVVSGLFGYVGVDLILGDDPAGTDDRVIEINPRLTTSYVGLRRLAAFNLAGMMLQVARGEEASAPAWRAGEVRFRPDGSVEDCSPAC